MVVRDTRGIPVGTYRGRRLPEPADPPGGSTDGRRIRDDARDGLYVMAFSLAASTSTVLGVVLLTKLGG
ncbi:MAG: hypothetical protein K0Q93_553 [Nocardioidaceae bacterium]|jgi:hypothetical protein|nr:hypothetical protein [Nocardioidaceae bacterium]